MCIISAAKFIISSSRNVWRRIVLAIKKLSNKFLKAEWSIVKISCNGKKWIGSLLIFTSVANPPIYAVVSKLLKFS
jgi:hypothetical protein